MAKHSRTAQSLLLAIGQAATAFSSLVMAALLSRYFSTEDYATYRKTILVFNVVAPLLALGLPQALYYFLPRAKDSHRRIILENVLMLSLLGCSISLFLVLGGNHFLAKHFNNPELATTLFVFAPYPLLMAPLSAVASCLLVYEKARAIAVYNVSTRLIALFIMVGAALYWKTPLAVVIAMVTGALIAFPIGLWMVLRLPKTGSWRPSLSSMRRQIAFSIPLGLAVAVSSLTMNTDKVLVSIFFEDELIVATYLNGAMEIPLIAIITGSASSVLLADVSKLIKEGKVGEALSVWKRCAVKVAGILYPVFGGMMLMAPEIMTILYSKTYVGSAAPFRIYLFLLIIRVAFFGVLFQGDGRSKLILKYSAISLFLNLGLSLLLLNIFGVLGAAVGSIIVLLGFTAPYCCRLIRKEIVKDNQATIMPIRELAHVMALTLAALAAGFLCKWIILELEWPFIVQCVVSTSVFAIVVLSLSWWRRTVDFRFLRRRHLI